MRYIVHAYDFTDEQAQERRLAARPQHFERARQLKEEGHFVLGGALLSSQGTMMGSLLLVEFDNENDLQLWLDTEPYVVGRVWEKIDVKPFRQADI